VGVVEDLAEDGALLLKTENGCQRVLAETAYICGPGGIVKSRKVRGIARDTLKFILEASRSSLPAEFAGLLQVENEIITEVLICRARKIRG